MAKQTWYGMMVELKRTLKELGWCQSVVIHVNNPLLCSQENKTEQIAWLLGAGLNNRL